jgi:hypothetical protein
VIWLAWRQLRTQAIIAGAVLVALGVVLALNGAHLVHLYDTAVVPCAGHNDCPSVTQNFDSQAKWNHALDALILIAPALIGVFWGAPLVARELETRTNRLAWTQSVTRARWFTVKLAVVGVGSLATAGLLSLMVTWWASPYDKLQNTPYGVFDQRDIVPVAYALFAFALGVTAGTVIRKTLPAMAATLVAYIGARFIVGHWIRPALMSPIRLVTQFKLPAVGTPYVPGAGSVNSSDWIITEHTLNAAGHVVGQGGGIGPNGAINFVPSGNGTVTFVGVGKCQNTFPTVSGGSSVSQIHSASVVDAMNQAAQRCVASFHLRTIVTVEPASRFWTLQWCEAAIFVAGAVALAVLCFWWLRNRVI